MKQLVVFCGSFLAFFLVQDQHLGDPIEAILELWLLFNCIHTALGLYCIINWVFMANFCFTGLSQRLMRVQGMAALSFIVALQSHVLQVQLPSDQDEYRPLQQFGSFIPAILNLFTGFIIYYVSLCSIPSNNHCLIKTDYAYANILPAIGINSGQIIHNNLGPEILKFLKTSFYSIISLCSRFTINFPTFSGKRGPQLNSPEAFKTNPIPYAIQLTHLPDSIQTVSLKQ